MNKSEFITILKSERARFEKCLNAIEPHRMSIGGVSGTYSVCDILAHLAAYDRALIIWLREARAGRVYVDATLDQPDLDARNAVIFEQNKGRDPKEILSYFYQTLDELEAAVEQLTEEELTRAELTGWFVLPRWQRKQELWKCIANDSYEHHQQHLIDMERYLVETS